MKAKPIIMKKHIPNLITLLNLLSGCIGIKYAFESNFELAFLFLCLAVFFDFFDGFFARLFKVQGPLGVQLDSLADMVSCGVLPGVVMYQLLTQATDNTILPYLGFIITLGSCMRLAKFNIDTRQTDSFIGLPTPANSLFILSLPLIVQTSAIDVIVEVIQSPIFLIVVTLLSAYILNAELPLFSLKIKNFSFQKYKLQIVFLIISLILLLVLQYLGVALVILIYVLLSAIFKK